MSEVELLLKCSNEPPRADAEWVQNHQQRRCDASETARMHLKQHADERKQTYDRRTVDLPLAVGDRVYLRNRQVRGRNKIQDVWDNAVYKVVCRQGVNHVYTVEREDGRDATKTINRADIRACTQDPGTVDDTQRRRLPCTPGSSSEVTDSDSSVGTSDKPLVYMVNRSRGERSSSTDTLPEAIHDETVDDETVNELSADDETIRRRSSRRGAGRHSNPYGLPRSAWAQ